MLVGLDVQSPEIEFDALTGTRWRHATYWRLRGGGSPAARLVVAAARLGCGIAADHLARIIHWTPPIFPLTGAALLSHGVDKGPVVGEMLRKAEQIWVSEDFTPTDSEPITRIGVDLRT